MQEGVRRRRNGRGLMFLKCWRMLAVAAAVLALSGIVAGCGAVGGRKKQKPFDVQYLTYFDTVTSITIYAEDEEQFAKWEQLVHSELERYHQLYDIYHSYEGVNNIKVINDHAGISPVEVSEDILDLLEFSLKEYELTKGGVHVGMGSVLSIWHDYREMALGESKFPMVPSMDELESAAKHMNIQDIHLDRQAGTVFLADPEMRLDVGAVAKGYTAQRLADTLRKSGVTNALLSLGGNVVTIGARGDGKPWRVGIQNPDLGAENLEALKKGIVNLEKHIENLQKYGVPVVVTLNSFITDSEAETAYVREFCETRGCEFALSEVWEKGGEGGIALAEKVLKAIDEKENHFHVLYENELSLQDKIKKIAQEIYGASDVVFAPAAAKQLKRLTELGFGDLPVCMAKNQYSLSDDPTLLGRPSGFELNVREVYVSAGAGFVVVLTGAVMTMPGLPKAPAAYNIDVDDSGRIVGLF